MALSYYGTIECETQGNIEGSCDIAPHEGTMELYAFDWTLESPRDAASGLATGKRRHKPIIITKAVDKATPKIIHSLAHNTNLTAVEFKFFRPSSTGTEEHFFTVKCMNATIASIAMCQLNNKHPENMQHEFFERVALTYQKIEWIWEIDQIMTEDDWKSRS